MPELGGAVEELVLVGDAEAEELPLAGGAEVELGAADEEPVSGVELVPAGGEELLAADEAAELLDAETGAAEEEGAVPTGTTTPPATWEEPSEEEVPAAADLYMSRV